MIEVESKDNNKNGKKKYQIIYADSREIR